MSWTRRRYQVLTAGLVVAAWAAVYAVMVATSEPPAPPESAAKVNRELAILMAVPTLVYVAAALLVLHFWLTRAGARMSAMDPPERALAAAVATLPEHRRDWGAAMTAELAEVRGRSARWRFALSCAMAALWPRTGPWAVPALLAAVVVAATVAAGPVVDAAVPGLGVFAASFLGLAGALMVLAVARSRRARFPVPAATALVVGGVAASIVMTVVFLLREPSAAQYLPPTRAVLLAAVLAGCLWVAVTSPRSLGASRRAPYIGAGAALAYVVGQLVTRRITTDPRFAADVPEGVAVLLGLSFFLGPAALYFVPALWAGLVDRSFRSGVQAGAWAAIASLPLTYALWLYEGLRIYPITGELVFAVDPGPIGANLADAVLWCLEFAPVVGIPCAVFGAAVAANAPRAIQANRPA
ncbi:hypothetical protein [Phytohabitans rumicis]|uniref:Uncharacterized protein n=1 Tax=Phytohabitans rumicis TaxID=1076125 RepID=A0A6V8LEE0_9ACTN|nr:hypothetical protein [Phytohabitans rumicis]GFJ95612.1 hypothetical protein Prum_092540 [Phytohabitans rumicis]